MTKKLFGALAFAAMMLLNSSVFAATPCSSGAALQFVGVGSSAQFNTLAYATTDLIAKAATGPANIFSVTGKDSLGNNTVQILDARPGVNKTDSATTWIIWDSGATCNVYTYWSVDSTVGVKDFSAYNLITVGATKYSVEAAYGEVSADVETTNFSGTECGGATKCTTNKIGGLADTETSVPATVVAALSVIPANIPPAARPAYCGVKAGVANSGQYCYFNAAGTDIRPEDAYIATVRALTTIPTSGHLTGLGYNNAACGGDGLATGSKIGCPFYDSFGGNKVFNSLLFKLNGVDPIGGGTVPSTTTFDVGAAPVVVFVSNGDTTANEGFGATNGNGGYIFNNINRQILAQVFQGRTHCTTDLLTSGVGEGKPIQVVQREALSGTYNTFEYTGVRTIGGSANPGVGLPTAVGETSDEWSGQEQGVDPSLNFNTGAGCPGSGATAPNGSESCGDPLWIETKSGGCGAGLRLRAIGTGQEVPAAAGKSNSGASIVTDGIGYSFWSYGNFSPATSGFAHYLTVDGIDPLFTTPGGATDAKPNPNGAYNLPQCNFSSLPCFQLPFTHVADGSYPLWNVLRIMSFANTAAQATPATVVNLVAYDEIEVADPARATSDFVPFLNTLVNGGTLAAPKWTGNLNLFVFRSHYSAPGGPSAADNGHHSCITGGVASFTGVSLQGGSPSHATCLIDKGNDLGGSVLTVQSDVDWNLDAGTPIEEYNVHQ
jgi:hypothetical protein